MIFLCNLEFHAACTTIFNQMNYNGHIYYSIMVAKHIYMNNCENMCVVYVT